MLLLAFHNYSVAEGEAAETAVYKMLYEADQLPVKARLGSGEQVDGQVHFFLPGMTGHLDEARLIVPVVDLADARRYLAAIPLSGL